MTPGEIYDLKRNNFIDKTIENFKYLVNDFGYSGPTHRIGQQDDGTIILDEFHYENKLADRLVTVSNAYHPVDYGFEICVYRPSISKIILTEKCYYFYLKKSKTLDKHILRLLPKD